MSRETEDLTTLEPKKVTIYTCGLTVYSQPHIGNWVAYIYWDILVRTLKVDGYDVNRVQNITDVGHLTSDEDVGEDKMLKGALKEGVTAWQVAEKYMKIADDEAYTQLRLLRPDHMPRATDYIQQQIYFVKILEEKGYTYILEDGVYFDTSRLEAYGKLSRLDIKGLRFGARVEDTGKKNWTDFAIWKLSAEGEKRDMEWESPWGTGFPGWHLECSVMARELLGDTIDIHTGGIDHIPVHHTNEIAQSEAVTGKTFANFWVHTNHLKVDGSKMSKSLGNIYTLADIKEKGFSLDAFKLMVLSKHYATEGNFTWEIMDSFQNVLEKLNAWSDLQFQSLSSPVLASNYLGPDGALKAIKRELCTNLNTPNALALINGMINRTSEIGIDSAAIATATKEIDALLGLNLSKRKDITAKQKTALKQRAKARTNKDWAASDVLRDELKELGLEISDSSNNQIWSQTK